MGTKNNPGNFDCYANAEPDEPMFVLLGRDPHAAAAVRKWAADREVMIERGEKPESDIALVVEAFACADAMEWYAQNVRDAKMSKPDLTCFIDQFPLAMEAIARVHDYDRGPLDKGDYLPSLLRHLFKSGEHADHDAALAWNAIARLEMREREKQDKKNEIELPILSHTIVCNYPGCPMDFVFCCQYYEEIEQQAEKYGWYARDGIFLCPKHRNKSPGEIA